MLNKFIGMGRFVKDPELRTTQNGKNVASFTIAVDRDKDKADFVSCVAWDRTAEFVSRYFRKGQLAVVEGRLQSRDWNDRDGNKRVSWEIVCSNVYFAERKQETEQNTVKEATFDELEDDGDLPF